MIKIIFSLIFTLFCQVMSLMIAPIWLDDLIVTLKKHPLAHQKVIQPENNLPASTKITPASQINPGLVIPEPDLANKISTNTLDTIKQAQLKRLEAKRVQILQNYGVSEQQLDCQNLQNQQILNQAYSHNLKTDRFLASAETCLATNPGGCLENCFNHATEKLVSDLLVQNQANSSQIVVGSCHALAYTETMSDTKMFAYCSALTPGKHFLGIDTHSYLVKNLNDMVTHKGHKISCQLLFSQLIGHELCHIKHQDNLTVTLLSAIRPKPLDLTICTPVNTKFINTKINTTAYEAFCEERADTLSILDCADPLAAAEYLYDNCAEDLYVHRKSPEWLQLIQDLRSYYKNQSPSTAAHQSFDN